MLLPCNLYIHAIFKASKRRSSLLDYIAFCMFNSSTDDGRMKNLEKYIEHSGPQLPFSRQWSVY